MKVVVEHIQRKLYLRPDGQWTDSRTEAKEFASALVAISFCLRTRAREVRLLGKSESEQDVYLYPFGGDPAVRRELKKLRRSIRESRRLKAERRIIQGRIDALLAEGKETKKQFPFQRTLKEREASLPSPGKVLH